MLYRGTDQSKNQRQHCLTTARSSLPPLKPGNRQRIDNPRYPMLDQLYNGYSRYIKILSMNIPLNQSFKLKYHYPDIGYSTDIRSLSLTMKILDIRLKVMTCLISKYQYTGYHLVFMKILCLNIRILYI